MKSRKKTILIVSLIVTMLFIIGCVSTAITGDDLIKGSKENFIVQGYVEAKEININTKVPGQIEDIKINEGEKVKKGDILIFISSESIYAKKEQVEALVSAAEGQLMAAEAAKQAALAQYEKAENGARLQEIEQAKAGFDLAEKTYNRVKTLYDEGACSTATFDEVKTKYEVAKQQYDMAKQGAREEDVLAAKAVLAQAESMVDAAEGKLLEAKGALEEVNTYIDDTIIKAPMDGTITSLNVEIGELVSTGMPLVTVSNMDKPWVELSIPETDLYMVELDQEVDVEFPAYPDKVFKGMVTQINKKPDFATKRATNNNGEFDILSFGIKVELKDIDEPIYSGMTAVVDFGKRDEK